MTGRSRARWLERAEAAGIWLENCLLTTLLGALISIAFLQIVLRNVFSTGLVWADGGTRLLVLWLAVIGAVAASRDGRHIAINLSARLIPEAWHRLLFIVVDFFTMAVSSVLAWHAARFVAESRAFGDTLLGDWPAWMLQLVLPVGFALIAYRFALKWLRAALRIN